MKTNSGSTLTKSSVRRSAKPQKPLRKSGGVHSAVKTIKKTGLSTKTSKPRKRLAPEQKSAQQLVKLADAQFSKYVRLRDSSFIDGAWVGECITCPKQLIVYKEGKWSKNAQNGHMIGRGVHQLRYDEENCNLQCSHCNAWLDKDEMIERYRRAIDLKYGDNVYKSLKARSKAEGALKRLTKAELLQVIHDSKEQIDWYLTQGG